VAVDYAVTIAIAVFFLGMGIYALAAPGALVRIVSALFAVV
jgi:hypothetical protein